jgi:VanZ family protein
VIAAWQWLRRRPVLYLWLPLLAWMGLIFYLSSQPDLPQPGLGWWDEVVSSGAHAFVFGVLAILWMRVLNGKRHAGWATLALTMAYTLSDEFHQFFVPGRYADPWDLACDGLGAGLALILWFLWRRC